MYPGQCGGDPEPNTSPSPSEYMRQRTPPMQQQDWGLREHLDGKWKVDNFRKLWSVDGFIASLGMFVRDKTKNIYQIRRRNIDSLLSIYTLRVNLHSLCLLKYTAINGHYRKINLDRALSAFFMTRHTLELSR